MADLSNIELVSKSVEQKQSSMFSRSGKPPSANSYDQAKAKAVQSIAQTAALTIQDASEMLRNISTVELTAIGVATAKWLENPADPKYKEIIDASMKTIETASTTYMTIGQNAAKVLDLFKDDEVSQ